MTGSKAPLYLRTLWRYINLLLTYFKNMSLNFHPCVEEIGCNNYFMRVTLNSVMTCANFGVDFSWDKYYVGGCVHRWDFPPTARLSLVTPSVVCIFN